MCFVHVHLCTLNFVCRLSKSSNIRTNYYVSILYSGHNVIYSNTNVLKTTISVAIYIVHTLCSVLSMFYSILHYFPRSVHWCTVVSYVCVLIFLICSLFILRQQCTHIEQQDNIVVIMYNNYLVATDYIDPSVHFLFLDWAVIPVLTDW